MKFLFRRSEPHAFDISSWCESIGWYYHGWTVDVQYLLFVWLVEKLK